MFYQEIRKKKSTNGQYCVYIYIYHGKEKAINQYLKTSYKAINQDSVALAEGRPTHIHRSEPLKQVLISLTEHQETPQ